MALDTRPESKIVTFPNALAACRALSYSSDESEDIVICMICLVSASFSAKKFSNSSTVGGSVPAYSPVSSTYLTTSSATVSTPSQKTPLCVFMLMGIIPIPRDLMAADGRSQRLLVVIDRALFLAKSFVSASY